MNIEEKLIKITNTLARISTRGEDTLMMADCLRAMEQVINEMHSAQDKEAE